MYFANICEFSELLGKTITKFDVSDDEIFIECSDGSNYDMYHSQACCESVYIESVVGDVNDLIGTPILLAEESSSDENPEGVEIEYQDCFEWTFYKLATIKGYVDIRWYGSSNGYYSTSVSFVKTN